MVIILKKLVKDLKIICKLKLEKHYCDRYCMKGWDYYPLHYVINYKSTYHQKEFTKKKFKPTKYLEKCSYIKKILKDLNTEIYYVNLARLKAGKIISAHKDNDIGVGYWDNIRDVIRNSSADHNEL